MIYFAKSIFSRRSHEKLWLDTTSILQVRVLVLSREVGYLLNLNKLDEKP